MVLPSVYEYMSAELIQESYNPRKANDFGTRPHNGCHFQFLQGFTCMEMVSGLDRSKISFAQSMTMSSSWPMLVML